jgi:effector-binding domain-containing protein
LDNTYEAITNYLDGRRMEAKDLFIEQYVTDPLSTDEDHLIVNVLVLVK